MNNVSKTVAKADVKADSNSKVQLSIENQPTASTTEEPENAKNNFDEKDSVVDQASPETEQNDKATNQVSSDQDVSKKEDSKAKLTSTKDQQNKVDQKKITKSTKRRLQSLTLRRMPKVVVIISRKELLELVTGS